MKKIFLLLFLFIILVVLSNCSLNRHISTITINNKTFQVELAKTLQEHIKGLSGQGSLKENQGMLFIFDDYGIRNFWMKDMKFPLDIIWIKDNQVIGCEKNLPVLQKDGKISQVNSSEEVNYVLEVNSGVCEKYKIKKGDKVEIDLINQ